MKMLRGILATILLVGMIVLAACSSDIADCLPVDPEAGEMQTMRMHFQVTVTPFDLEASTRATDEWTWKDKATVFIQFKGSNSVVRGHAVYKNDSWDVSYTGDIGTSGVCEVYFFDGADASDKSSVKLSDEMAIYADKNSVYSVSGGVVTLTAGLSPLTSRLCFRGQKGISMSVSGITTYTGYDAVNNVLKTSSAPVIRIVDDSGETPYIYGAFTNNGARELLVENSINDVIFSKSFSSTVFAIGKSGYMTLPTEDTNKGWAMIVPEAEKVFSLRSGDETVNLKMKRVAFGTCLMGAYNDGNYVTNAHRIYASGYYIGETEVTNALWYAVMGSKPKYQKNDGDEYPVANVSWEDIAGKDGFMEKLNAMTGQDFRLPTETEWEFAAKGGRKSKNYLFAGGSTAENVAWYSQNSGGTSHPVAMKTPNELGLYDMSGNVSEWCADFWATYAPGIQFNPVMGEKLNSDNHVVRGGSFYHNYDASYVARRNSAGPTSASFSLGFRLAL